MFRLATHFPIQGQSRYYQGPLSNFKPCDWNKYTLTTPGAYKIQLADASQCRPNEIKQEFNLNTFGKLTNEYVVPAINYYMTSTIDSLFDNKKISFQKLDKTNCVYGRIQSPGASGNGYKYLGDFDTYEQCTQSANIDSNAKAITIHDNSIRGWAKKLGVTHSAINYRRKQGWTIGQIIEHFSH